MDTKINGISVIICCYNSASRLSQTLTYLSMQRVNEFLKWELILVDNNSNDDTVEVAKRIWLKLGAPTELKIVGQPKAGLSYAREKGISAAQFDLFLFCDDDNWLQKDYVQNSVNFFLKDPNIGALGGWSEAMFEEKEPVWFEKFKGNFAVGKPVEESGPIITSKGFLYGAGMVIPRSTFTILKNYGFKNILSDRKGKSLSSGGDVELMYAIKLLNLPLMFSDTLFFYHFMPSERMHWSYLLKLRQSMYWSNFVLNIYLDSLNNKPFTMVWVSKKALKSVKYIYDNKKRLSILNPRKKLLLENQIAIRRLLIHNLKFYYQTRITLEKLKLG